MTGKARANEVNGPMGFESEKVHCVSALLSCIGEAGDAGEAGEVHARMQTQYVCVGVATVTLQSRVRCIVLYPSPQSLRPSC